MSRSPSRDRSTSRAGRAFAGASGTPAATDPSGMTGNILWVRAKDLAAGSVTTWTDQSGTGHNLTGQATKPVATVTRTPSGGKAVVFGGPNTGYFTATDLVTATPSNSGDFGGGGGSAAGLTDGNPATYWASLAGLPQYAQLDYGTAQTAYSYNVQCLVGATATPTAWTYAGSSDPTFATSTTLDTRSSQTGWTASQMRSFTIASPAAFRYYRLTVTAASATNVGIAALEPRLYAAAELWVVVKATGITFQSSWQMQPDLTTLGASHYQYSDGKVYEAFGLGNPADRASFTPTLATTSWRLYRVANNGTTWQAWIDNASQGTLSSKPVGWGTTWKLGSLHVPNGNWYWGGEIAEILVRSQISTAGEVTNLIAYFNSEHGLTVT